MSRAGGRCRWFSQNPVCATVAYVANRKTEDPSQFFDPFMRKLKNPHSRREMLNRYGRVTSWHASVSARADRPRGQSPRRENRASILLQGELTEPLGDVTRFLIQVSPTNEPGIGNADVPNVGAFISVKPELQGVVDMTEGQFQLLMTLAASGRLEWCFVAFTVPFRRSSLIVSINFTSQPPDDES